MGWPPYTGTTERPVCFAIAAMASATCTASSRVGARTMAWVLRSLGSSFSMSGRPNAAVLPVPVWAWASMSRPSRRTGIAFAWMAVAVSKPISAIALATGSVKGMSANFTGSYASTAGIASEGVRGLKVR